jgi:hypothetical protein
MSCALARRIKRFVPIVVFLCIAGCAETTMIRTYPPGSAVVVNGDPIGSGPVEFRVPRTQIPAGGLFHYRVEHEGYRAADGEFRTTPAAGRIAGGIFTIGILFLFKNPTTIPGQIDIVLEPIATTPGTRQPSIDVSSRLRRLERLFEQGAITEDEYKRERSKLLNGL